jgi:hypothetical protein
VSIAQQIATPNPTARARRRGAPPRPAPSSRRTYALVRILGLMVLTALGAALIAGTVATAAMMLLSGTGA